MIQQATVAEKVETPLQRRLEQFGYTLLWLALAVVAVVFGLGYWRGEPLLEMFLTSVSLAVAAVPEGLPAVVTITLALGVTRHGEAPCADPEAAGGGDAWLRHRDLHRQDGNVNEKRNDGHESLRRR